MTSSEAQFLLGVNYWPRRKAMYWWHDFDAGEVREEFAEIAEIGLNCVRLFLLWDDWMPTPDQIAPQRLTELTQVADIAHANGLKLNVTFFTGHMSGPNWSPQWLLGEGIDPLAMGRQLVSGGRLVSGTYRNMFTDPQALNAERLLLNTIVNTLKDHPALWLWNMGNEPDLFAQPPTSAHGEAWMREMRALIRAQDTQHMITCGLHVDSLFRDNGLRVDSVFRHADLAVMHAYPMYSTIARHPLDPEFVPFTCALTRALSGKPVLMEEFGGCTALAGQPSYVMRWELLGNPREQFMAAEDDLAAYLEAALENLLEVGTVGAFIWCYADYHESLWDRPPCGEYIHERFFGLVRPDGTQKPHAKVLQRFAAQNHTVRQHIPAYAQINIHPEEYYQAPAQQFKRLYDHYLRR